VSAVLPEKVDIENPKESEIEKPEKEHSAVCKSSSLMHINGFWKAEKELNSFKDGSKAVKALTGNSLFCLSTSNKFRQCCAKI